MYRVWVESDSGLVRRPNTAQVAAPLGAQFAAIGGPANK